ncbi:MAG: bacteriohopanetetrol glucosamine biosynthesis glycosyltransferase HpnI [Bryobacteraceae bacterium]
MKIRSKSLPKVFWLLFGPPAAYQILAIAASLRHLWRGRVQRTPSPDSNAPGVSVLKPLRGLDPNTQEAFVSQVRQRYPRFEILFGVRDENDPSVAAVRHLQNEYPNVAIRLVVGAPDTPNGKVGTLLALSGQARYPVWVVNDSDIRVDPDYLLTVVAPLSDPAIGVVTCPYRAMAHTVPAAWESLGIATDFMPSTLVAQLLSVREFGLGSTLAFRAEDLQRVGGFAAFADYIADDYQLAKRITSLGKRALLSTYVVETSLGEATWSGVWLHQLRWARTIRTSKGGGYAGLPLTHAGVWAIVLLCMGAWLPAVLLLLLRMASGLLTGGMILRSPVAIRLCCLAPVWDMYALAVWAASYMGRTIYWRDRSLQIDREGRIRG